MTDRADVDRLSAANRRIVAMARADLDRAWRLGLTADDLETVVRELVREYGEMAAAVAAEWYDEIRAQHGDLPRYRARPASGVSDAQIAGTVGYVDHLRNVDGEALGVLSGALQRYVSYSSRETVRRNVARDPARPRFARVPTGAKTCSWCDMLASRGFVYISADTATEDYHDDCNCQAVVEFDRESAHIAGYDPDAMYERYQAAVKVAGGDPKDIAAALRRMHPDVYTDGVHPH